ncbi:MAG: DUF6746 family protein [Dichotomicrobium sp.]
MNVKLTSTIAAVVIGLSAFAGSAVADERVEHYEAKPSETLEEAVKNFAEYNKKVAEVLKKDELTASDLERIHELSYTIEIALAKINDGMCSLPQTLERLHLASEEHNADEVRGVGEVYLETAQTVVP